VELELLLELDDVLDELLLELDPDPLEELDELVVGRRLKVSKNQLAHDRLWSETSRSSSSWG